MFNSGCAVTGGTGEGSGSAQLWVCKQVVAALSLGGRGEACRYEGTSLALHQSAFLWRVRGGQVLPGVVFVRQPYSQVHHCKLM